MNKILDRIAQGMLRPINPYSMVIVGIFTFTWGLWLAFPEWDVFTTAPLFSRISEFAPEWAWGSWAILTGIIIILAVMRSGRRLLSFAMGFAIWHWWTVAGMLWWGDWRNTGGITYSFIAVLITYAYLNFKVNFVKGHKGDHSRF